jgi:hypothetical protein
VVDRIGYDKDDRDSVAFGWYQAGALRG